MAHSDPPADASPERWTVTVDGAVADPWTISVAELAAMETEAVASSTDCEGEDPVEEWLGVRIGALLDRTDPDAEASHALVQSSDEDFACGFDIDRLRDAHLAVRLGGDPIPTDRGGPVRLLVDDADCWERVKWVTRIGVLDAPPGDDDTARDRVPADD